MSKRIKEKQSLSSEGVNRRAFLQTVAGTGVAGVTPKITGARVATRSSKEMPTSGGGHLYMQTNEVKNAIIHYHRLANGTLSEVERVATGGAGSGILSPIYHTNRPNRFESAGSVILSPDRRFLFTTNGADNSVSSFSVNKEGRLTLVDRKPTGNTTNGGAKSLADAPSSRTLFVLHTVGPDHIRLMSVDGDGKINVGPIVKIDTSAGLPSELCWLAVSPDDRFVFTTNFGYSYITSHGINGKELEIAKDPACPKVRGDGTFRAINGTVSSGPSIVG
jgi:hypothetical protein